MNEIDLGIAWEWEYDLYFVHRLEHACHRRRLSTYLIHSSHVHEAIAKYDAGELAFRCFLDRGSDAMEEFAPLARLVTASGARVINAHHHLTRCADKATMHLDFITAGLHVPYTIILPPYRDDPTMPSLDLSRLGRPFIIKPAFGSGGAGVELFAESAADVVHARTTQVDQKFLLQEKIRPALLGGQRAWFRAYYLLDRTFLAWWNDLTHVYRRVAPAEEEALHLSAMRDIVATVAQVSQLDFFSAEIAQTADGRFVVVDYVNDTCDMRVQSMHHDGVPDALVEAFIHTIVSYVAGESLTHSDGPIIDESDSLVSVG